jgi:Flp pilus assembly protein TadD
MGRDTRPVRIALIVAALLAGTWLTTQVRAARAESRLTTIAFEKGDAKDAQSLLSADRLLNPDHRPDLFEGVIKGRRGDFPGAVAAFRRVTNAEPENIEAWGLLASAAERTDPNLAVRAQAAARKLSPPVR